MKTVYHTNPAGCKTQHNTMNCPWPVSVDLAPGYEGMPHSDSGAASPAFPLSDTGPADAHALEPAPKFQTKM